MAKLKLTEQQQAAVENRGGSLLVSAAAGSGKTKVLVERLFRYVTEDHCHIDDFLIITYTKAAAAELRSKIAAELSKRMAETPEDRHLRSQLLRVYQADIKTVDAFCTALLRENTHLLAQEGERYTLTPDFRVLDENDAKLLRQRVLTRVLERFYEELDEGGALLADTLGAGRDDSALEDLVLETYEKLQSHADPEHWLAENRTIWENRSGDFDETPYAAELLAVIRRKGFHHMEALRRAGQSTVGGDLYKGYGEKFLRASRSFAPLAAAQNWEAARISLDGLEFPRLTTPKGMTEDPEVVRLKGLWENAKTAAKKLAPMLAVSDTEAMEDLQTMAPAMTALLKLTADFSDAYRTEKLRMNCADFSDQEHLALRLLVERNGAPTELGRQVAGRYREILVDEYQDTNEVQNAIFRAVSREGKNLFTVGDVKQSIYRFRLARPELFMKKYDSYSLEESTTQRIDLHKNFRSREEVLTCTNDIFYKIMARSLGNVEYDAEAALYPGASYPAMPVQENSAGEKAAEDEKVSGKQINGFTPEILLADSNDELLEDTDFSDKKTLEAKMVAEKIRHLMKTQPVTDKATGELRAARYSDIVILLRSLSGWADSLVEVLNGNGIPAHTVSSTGYFSTVEVQTVLSMLRLLDNPRQDIPMAAVLRSPMAGLTDEELAVLRLEDGSVPFHEAVLELAEGLYEEDGQKEISNPEADQKQGKNADEKPENHIESTAHRKLLKFYKKYRQLRQLVPDTPIHELIEIILCETGYGHYVAAMPAGNRRTANLNMLLEKAAAYEKTSYKGLFHFVRYIDELQKYDVDFGEADMVGENEDVVRIMSIHKSKGLEFPIVIVSGMGKNFNKQDTRSKMVLHPELGIGLDYMDGKKRIKSPTIAKKAIAKQIDLENLGEELRVLYVALTRAKEKLILTGTLKDAPEKLEFFRQQAALYAHSSDTTAIPYLTRESAAGYLDWILPAVLSYGDKYPVRIVEAAELVLDEVENQLEQNENLTERIVEIEAADTQLVGQLKQRFSQRYPYQTDILRKNKYSVSELKHRAMREKFEAEQEETVPAFLEEPVTPTIPLFIQRQGIVEQEAQNKAQDAGQEAESKAEQKIESNTANRGALRGTAVHRVMECYDFTSEKSVQEQMDAMEKEEKITADMRTLVKERIVADFVSSETGKRMALAQRMGALYREKPFVMGFTEEELERYGFGAGAQMIENEAQTENAQQEIMSENVSQENHMHEEDLTLIQGIIDVFWIEDDGITVLDYKTDRVDTAQELIDRYATQLKLYADALERVFATRKLKVKEILIYSFRLEKLISIE